MPAAAAAIAHRNRPDAQPGAGGAHLHLDVPAVALLAHTEREQRIAPDRTERAHVGVAHAIEQPHAPAGQVTRRELVPGDAAGLAPAACARSDDKVANAGTDRPDQGGDRLRNGGTVAVHEYDEAGPLGGHRRREART